MNKHDKYNVIAEALLPCLFPDLYNCNCSACSRRPGVAAMLCRDGELLESARAIGEQRRVENEKLKAEVTRLVAAIAAKRKEKRRNDKYLP
jgi:hypothetical protein